MCIEIYGIKGFLLNKDGKELNFFHTVFSGKHAEPVD